MATAKKSSASVTGAANTKEKGEKGKATTAADAKESASAATSKSAAKASAKSVSVEDVAAPYDEPKLVKKLAGFLADSYLTYLKTQSYHWNVRGPNFYSLHLLFESQYQNLAMAIDTIAERIRALGADAPGSFEQFRTLSDIQEAKGVPSAEQMVADLAADHATLSRRARAIIQAMDSGDDTATADLITERLRFHDKSGWMLRSSLNKS